ncbi:MAG: hypothetical protein H6728_10345 [Myxococcales bacterium]|nr:hypothetical protein [Myxococcales bacterium]MCB9643459.1 hypothetical protein [Myxococcales bacterium]
MISHVWTVICSRSVIDEDTKNISLMDVVEQVTIDAESAKQKDVLLPLPFEVVTLWSREDEAGKSNTEARLRLLSPEGTEINQQFYKIDLSEHPRMRTRIRVPGLPFVGPGNYVFCVDLRRQDGETWREVARVPLQLQVESPQPKRRP